MKSTVQKLWIADNGDGTYRNPILYTDYSDPDVIRVGKDYYMAASSFSNAPAVPLLHSKDMINWKVISYVIERLPFERYNMPQHGSGAWAPAIRYHDGVFYVFVPFPDEGIAVYTAKDPRGKWSEPQFVVKKAGWIDPCPFWDDDGSMYMVNAFAKSRIGFNSLLYLCPLRDGGNGLTAVTNEGGFIYDGHPAQPTIEGPKLYKRNGYYYIFAPAGGVKTGWQTVLRSRNIMGPYEEKIVLHQGGTAINGPHQGAWVDTPLGEDWFFHFQDVGSAGRIIHLEPMRWVNDWPVIGVNIDENGCGEPVMTYTKPNVGAVYPIVTPDDSDFFDKAELGLQWQWNANYRKSWYEIGGGFLKLYAVHDEERRLCDAPNLLLQKWTAPEFRVTARLHLEELKDGDSCGMVSLGGCCDSLLICRKGVKNMLIQRTCTVKGGQEERTYLGNVDGGTVYLRMNVENAERVSWEISADGEVYRSVGQSTKAVAGAWVGVKVGLAAVHEGGGECGAIRADFFVFDSLDEKTRKG